MSSHTMAEIRSSRSFRWMSQLLVLMFVTSLFATLNGCGKPPTFNELIGNEEKKAETVKRTPQVIQSPKVKPIPKPKPKPKPKKLNPQEVIAAFLKLQTHKITDRDFARIANLTEGKETITELILTGSKLTSVGFQQIGTFPAVVKLDVSRRKLTDSDIAMIAEMTQLREIDLEGTGLNDQTLQCVANLDQLKVLDISSNPFTDKGFIHLKKLNNLEKLRVYSTGIDGSGFTVLSGNRSIKSLDVGRTAFREYGFKYIKGWGALEELRMFEAGINEEVLRFHKVVFSKYRNLKILNLTGNDLAIISMKRLSGMKNLEKLHLRNNKKINAAGLNYLKASKKLQYLDIEGTFCRQSDAIAMLKYFQKFNNNLEIRVEGKSYK